MGSAKTLLDATKAFFEAQAAPLGAERVAVGASGGPDSMVLVDLLRRLEIPVDVVHVNYHIRGDASDADAELVRAYCRVWKLGFELFDATQAMPLRDRDGSVQAPARRVRYRVFARYAESHGIKRVAVGHHRDDQVETVLINLLRRTGMDGIAGMRPDRKILPDSEVRLIRPMLTASREDILRYAEQNGVPWRSDASNADAKYLRARIRHRTVPALVAAAGDGVVDDVLAMSEAMQRLVDKSLPAMLPEELAPENVVGGRVPLAELMQLDPVVRPWLLLRYLRTEIPGAPARRSSVEAMARLLNGPTGKQVRFRQGTVWKERGYLRFERSVGTVPGGRRARTTVAKPAGATVAKVAGTTVVKPAVGQRSEVRGEYGKILIQALEAGPENEKTSASEIFVDGDRLSAELVIRPWLPGDRFRPFGMTGTKKVKSLLTERHVPTSMRGRVHVLCDGDQIVWVIGHRMDERYRVGRATRCVLRISHETAAVRGK